MRGNTHDYNREMVQKVIDLCNEGLPLKQIASDLDVVYESVVRMVNGQYYDDMGCENYIPYQGTPQQKALTNKQAKKIRDLHHESGLRIGEICNQLPDIDRSIIVQILQGKTYKNVGGTIGILPYQVDSNDVAEIRNLYLDTNLSTDEIAELTGYTKSQIVYALKNDNYDCEIDPIESLDYRRSQDSMKIPQSERDVIRERYTSGSIKMPALAREYGVDISYISRIIKGER